jgi:hypothetical protein
VGGLLMNMEQQKKDIEKKFSFYKAMHEYDQYLVSMLSWLDNLETIKEDVFTFVPDEEIQESLDLVIKKLIAKIDKRFEEIVHEQ